MRKKHKSQSRKNRRGENPLKSWRRNIGRNKKIHMLESRKQVEIENYK
jgi:hypothetical protein